MKYLYILRFGIKTSALGAVLGLTGCWLWTGPEAGLPPAEAKVVQVSDLGPLRFDPAIRCRDGGYSGAWKGQSFWWFGDTVTAQPGPDGFCWRSNTACRLPLPPRQPAGQWQFTEYKNAAGFPEEMLPFTADEADYNRLRFNSKVPEKERRRWALWPGPFIAAPSGGYAVIFFSRIKCGPDGAWDFRGDGTSLLIWRDSAKKPERGPILFPEGDIQLGQAAVAVGDKLYVYGCKPDKLAWPILLGRVDFNRVTDRSAWEFYAGNDCWTTNAVHAVAVMDAAPMLTIHWSPYLRRYVAFYSVPLVNRLALRTAPRPEGPWSKLLVIADCIPPLTSDGVGSYSGLAHPELARENGRIEYLTYYRETGLFQGEIRLIELTLDHQAARE